jgi:membrane fusion protein, multidrug efflux system
VRQTQAGLSQSTAQLGIIHAYNQTPEQMLGRCQQLDDVDLTFARYAADAPAMRAAEAKLEAAKRNLAQDYLNIWYCTIVVGH